MAFTPFSFDKVHVIGDIDLDVSESLGPSRIEFVVLDHLAASKVDQAIFVGVDYLVQLRVVVRE